MALHLDVYAGKVARVMSVIQKILQEVTYGHIIPNSALLIGFLYSDFWYDKLSPIHPNTVLNSYKIFES